MEAIKRADGRYVVFIPAKQLVTGKRQPKYFDYKTGERGAEAFIKNHQANRRVHGDHAVTPEELHWIHVVRSQLGDLGKIGEVLEHWRKTGANIKPRTVAEATEEYIKRREDSKLADDTKNASRSRLRGFAKYLAGTRLDQITPPEIDRFLHTKTEGGNRRSFWKELSPFFAHAERQNWIAQNPLSKVEKPDWGKPKRGIYTPAQYDKLLETAESNDEYVLRYLVLAGAGFLRSAELLKIRKKDQVLQWEDIQLDRFIHVRKEVGKGGRERFIPLPKNESLYGWLSNYILRNKPSGAIIPISSKHLRERLQTIFDLAEIKTVANGLRHSVISYYLAMYPDAGVSRVSLWSGHSETTCRKHYLQALRKEQGEDWFTAINQLIQI